MIGVSFETLCQIAAAMSVLAALSAVRAIFLVRRRHGPPPARGLASRCSGLILEHPQSAGLLLLAGLGMLVPVAAVAAAALLLSTSSAGLYLFLPLLLAAVAASGVIGAASAVGVSLFAVRRLRGERASFGDAAAALRAHASELAAWAWASMRRRDGKPYNPFVLAAMLADDCDLSAATRRAQALADQAPQLPSVAAPLLRRAVITAVAGGTILVPLVMGYFSLPAMAFAGYEPPPLEAGYRLYALVGLLMALGLGAFLCLLTLRFSSAFAHAGAIYAYATGNPASRQRVLEKLPIEWVWPETAPLQVREPEPPQEADPLPPAPAPGITLAPPPSPDLQPSPAPVYEAAPLPELSSLPTPPPLPALGEPGESEGYSRETMLPQARRAELLGRGAPATPIPAQTRRRPPTVAFSLSRLLKRVLRLLLGVAVVAAAAAAGVVVTVYYDGPGIARRLYVLHYGSPATGNVEALEAYPHGGTLSYRIRFTFPGEEGFRRGWAFGADRTPRYLRRGLPVQVYVLGGPAPEAVLAQDYGYSSQRGALLLLIDGLLLIGAWSLVFTEL